MRLINFNSRKLLKIQKPSNYFPRNNFSINKLRPPWNILFFGTDNFSLASLKALKKEQSCGNGLINILEVVTTTKNTTIRKFATDQDLSIHDWPAVPRISFDIGLVVSFGHLIPKDIIDSFPLGMLNVHASLLPRWRGAAPIIYALMNGDKKTGVSIMRIKPGKFDIGEILKQEEVLIPEDMRMPELYNKLAEIGAQNLIGSLHNLPESLKVARCQLKEGVTFAPKINSTIANIDFSTHTAKQIYNLSRALSGLYPLVAQWDNNPIKIHTVTSYEICEHSSKVGCVIFDKGRKVLQISCLDGFIFVDKVGVLKKKAMSASDFNNGYLKKLRLEERLFR